MMQKLPEDKISEDEKRGVHITAMRRFHETYTADRDQRELAAEDLRFAQVEGEQWAKYSRSDDKPMYEINHVAAAVAQVTGAYKENRINTKVIGTNTAATKEVADTFQGLIRTIESKSNAQDAYTMAQFLLVNTGFAAWQVDHQFEDDGFDQELVIKSITTPLTSVWWDNGAREPNMQDSNWAFVVRGFTREGYKSAWGDDDSIVSFDNNSLLNSEFNDEWFRNDLIQVAEYYVKEPAKRTLLRMSDGSDVWLDKVEPVLDEMAQQQPSVIEKKRRVVETTKVVKYIMNGAKILSGPHPTPFKTIPLVAVYGENHYEKDNHYFRGMVRMAKDAQRIYNWNISTNIETMAKAPQDPYFITPAQIKGHMDSYVRMAVDNSPFMIYNEDPASPGPPKRTGAPSFNQAAAALQQQAADDIQITTGRPLQDVPANVGQEILLATKKSVDAGVQWAQSSMTRGVQYTAELLIGAAPEIYDQDRQIRITGADGKSEFVQINQTIIDQQTNKKVIVNDLSQGSYDVTSSTGPAFETERTAAANALAAMAQFDPAIIETNRDVFLGAIDSPIMDEPFKRERKRMIEAGIAEPTEDEIKEMQPTPEEQEAQQRELQHEQEQLDLNKRRQEAEIDMLEASASNETNKGLKARSEIENEIRESEKTNAESIKIRGETQKILTDIQSLLAEKGLVSQDNQALIDANAELMQADIEEEIEEKIEAQTDKLEEQMQAQLEDQEAEQKQLLEVAQQQQQPQQQQPEQQQAPVLPNPEGNV